MTPLESSQHLNGTHQRRGLKPVGVTNRVRDNTDGSPEKIDKTCVDPGDLEPDSRRRLRRRILSWHRRIRSGDRPPFGK